MSSVLVSPPPSDVPTGLSCRRIVLICFGFEVGNLQRQPWYTAHGLACGLAAHGCDVLLVTDARRPPAANDYRIAQLPPGAAALSRARPELLRLLARMPAERIYVVGGLTDLARLRALPVAAPVHYVVASPRLRPDELVGLPVAALTSEWRSWCRLAANAFLPVALLRRAVARAGLAGLVYLSPETRDRLVAGGLPAGPLLVPRAAPRTIRPQRADHQAPLLCYFGPPLALRGVDLAIDTFDALRARGQRARLRLLLRTGPHDLPGWLGRRIARSPWREHIEMCLGDLSPAELDRALADVDLFLLPFRAPVSEVPLVVIEAALTGRPVVVLDRPGVGAYARCLGGIVVGDPRELPDATMEALTADQRPPLTMARWSDWRAATVPLLTPPRAPVDGLRRLRMVALSGLDGAGKTTLAQLLTLRLARRGAPGIYVWSRFRNYASKPLLGLMRLCGLNRGIERDGIRQRQRRFDALPGLAHLFVLLQAVDQAIEICWRHRHRSGTVVADRCLYDALVDLAVETGLESLVIDRLGPLLERLLPAPRLCVVIERPIEATLRDRPDVAADPRLDARARLYRRVIERFGLPRLEVAGSPADTVAALERLLERACGPDAGSPP